MKEYIKSFMLISLVITSVTLTSLLVFGQLPWEIYSRDNDVKAIVDIEIHSADFLIPTQLVVHKGDGHHSIVHGGKETNAKFISEAYDLLSSLVLTYVEHDWQLVTSDQLLDWNASKEGLEFTLVPRRMPGSFWLNAWSEKHGMEESIQSGQELILRKVGITAGDEGHYRLYRVTNQGIEWVYIEDDLEALLSMRQEATSLEMVKAVELEDLTGNFIVDPGIYVQAEPTQMAVFRTTPIKEYGVSDPADYFTDFSVVRRREEKDLSVYYSDGRAGLQIYPNGTLIYHSPGLGLKSTSAWTESSFAVFGTSNRYVVEHGGFPQEISMILLESKPLYVPGTFSLQSPGEINGYSFRYGYVWEGYPVDAIRGALNVTVRPGGIEYYYRSLHMPILSHGYAPVITGQQALEALHESWFELGASFSSTQDKRIRDAYLGYVSLDNEALLKPAWTFITGSGKKVFINAFTGEILGWEEG